MKLTLFEKSVRIKVKVRQEQRFGKRRGSTVVGCSPHSYEVAGSNAPTQFNKLCLDQTT